MAGSWTDTSQKSLLTELFSDFSVNDSVFLSFSDSLLSSVWSLLFFNFDFLSFLGNQVDTVVIQVPLRERSGIDLDDTVLDESFSSDEFVIWCIVYDVEDSGFSGDWFRSPVEVSFFKSEGSEFVVATSDSDSSDSWLIVNKFSIWYWSGFLESSLFFMNWHSATSWSSLVSWISWNTHWWILSQNYDYKIFQFFLFILSNKQILFAALKKILFFIIKTNSWKCFLKFVEFMNEMIKYEEITFSFFRHRQFFLFYR